ncbi:MAG: hypothetical protein R2873_26990 [Caldilineaceae bacterium]
MLREQPQNRSEKIYNSPVAPWYTPSMVTDKIASIVLTLGTPRWWWVGFVLAGTGLMILLYTLSVLATVGVGIWGINIPVAWVLRSSIWSSGLALVTPVH